MVLTHWLMRARTLESVVARTPAAAMRSGVGADGVRNHHRAGIRQCLHLFPVLRCCAVRVSRPAQARPTGMHARPRRIVRASPSRCRCGRCRRSPGAGFCSAPCCCWRCWSLAGKRTGAGTACSRPSPTATACGRSSAAASMPAKAMPRCCWGLRGCISTSELPVWERLDGRRPIQLSFEGTSPLHGAGGSGRGSEVHRSRGGRHRAAGVLFRISGIRADAIRYTHKESPSQRIGQWLSMHLIEPYFAFDDADFALQTVLARQPWPGAPGQTLVQGCAQAQRPRAGPQHLFVGQGRAPIRSTARIARGIWRAAFQPSGGGSATRGVTESRERSRSNARPRRSRSCARAASKSLFVRLPELGRLPGIRDARFGRARAPGTSCSSASGAPGIHFEDYPELQGFYLPEWSHMTLRGVRALHRRCSTTSSSVTSGAPAQPRRRQRWRLRRQRRRSSPGGDSQEGFFTQPRGL